MPTERFHRRPRRSLPLFPDLGHHWASGPPWGTALPRGGEEHQGLPCFHASMLVCLSSSVLLLSMLLCFYLLRCHVPITPLPWFCGRLPFPHPLLNPSSFLYPSVFRTRTHERPRLRPRGPFPLSRPDVSCRLHTATVSQTSPSPPQPGC
jgi:hypothetical protein